MATGQHWLLDRLVSEGVDVYDGDFPTLRDRIGNAIARYRLHHRIACHYEGKRETYARLFERIYGARPPEVPRVTQQQAQGRNS